MANKVNFNTGYLEIVADTAGDDDAQYIPDAVWSIQDGTNYTRSYLNVTLEAIPEATRKAIRVQTTANLPGSTGIVWMLRYTGYTGTETPDWKEEPLTGPLNKIIVEYPLPNATYKFQLIPVEGGIRQDGMSIVTVTTAPDTTIQDIKSAYDKAVAALGAASTAQDTADGKIDSYFQSEMPSSGSIGDIWFDTNDGNKTYRHNGTTFVACPDSKIAQAILDAQTAQGTADGKGKIWYQTAQPTGLLAGDQGDLWVDTDDNLKLWAWNGSGWILAQDWYTANQKANSAYDKATLALQAAATAQDTADGKIDSFFQTTMPTTGSLGDIWFDTDDGNKIYRHNGSTFVACPDSKIAQAILDASTAQGTADGKAKIWYQTYQPTGLTSNDAGDLWVDTDDNLKLWAYNGSAWVLAQDWYSANQTATDAKNKADAAGIILTNMGLDGILTDQERPALIAALASLKQQWENVYTTAVTRGVSSVTTTSNKDSVWKPSYQYFATLLYTIPNANAYDTYGSVVIGALKANTGTPVTLPAGYREFNNGIHNVIVSMLQSISGVIATTVNPGLVKIGAGASVDTAGTLNVIPYTAGANISISNNVISATASGGGWTSGTALTATTGLFSGQLKTTNGYMIVTGNNQWAIGDGLGGAVRDGSLGIINDSLTATPCLKFSASGAATFSGGISATTGAFSDAVKFTGGAGQAPGSICYLASVGLQVWGKSGSAYDLSFYNAAGSKVMANPAGTVNMVFDGTIGSGAQTITSAGAMLSLNNTVGASSNNEIYFNMMGSGKYSIGTNIQNGASAAFEIYDRANSKILASFWANQAGMTMYGTFNTSNVAATNTITGNGVAANMAASTSSGGLSLYSSATTADINNYGIAFRTTATLGTHGAVTGDWATYFTMAGALNRGWIFRHGGNANVASIDGNGNASFNGLAVAGNFYAAGSTAKATISGNWAGAGAWGLWYTGATHEIKLGMCDDARGTVSATAANLNFIVDGSITAPGFKTSQIIMHNGNEINSLANGQVYLGYRSTDSIVFGASKATVSCSTGNITAPQFIGTASKATEASDNYFTVRGTSPSLALVDTDQGQTRYVHHNGGSIGFLNSGGNWVLRCDDSVTVGVFSGSLSGNASSASIASTVTINYGNSAASNYQMLWGSGTNVYGTSGIFCNPSIGTIYANHYRGSANVGGTGEAIHCPAGVYSEGTNWLYGTIHTNGNTINCGAVNSSAPVTGTVLEATGNGVYGGMVLRGDDGTRYRLSVVSGQLNIQAI